MRLRESRETGCRTEVGGEKKNPTEKVNDVERTRLRHALETFFVFFHLCTEVTKFFLLLNT